MYEFLRNLFASEQPVMERFNVVDPTAVGNNVRAISLAYTPSTDQSPTSVVSLFWTDSKNKIYEKQFQDEIQAQNLFGSMKQDLQEAADLTRTEKMESAASLVRSLLKRYAIYTDELVDGAPAAITNTNASKKKADELDDIDREVESPENVGSPQWIDNVLKEYEEENSRMGYIADQDDIMKHLVYVVNEEAMGMQIPEREIQKWLKDWAVWKSQQKKSSLGKVAKVVMQNLFFETPEELQKYQDMQKSKQPGGGKQLGDFKDDLPGVDEKKMPGEGLGDESEGEDGLAPSSLSYEDYEKQKAQEAKSLTKRIEREVKDQVKSALEQKVASTFDETDDELIDAMRKKGRTWEEIKNYFTKELQYDKDSVAAYIDALREAENGMAPTQEPGKPPANPHTPPSAPKPPEELVSPETHDKLVKEIDDKATPPEVVPPEEHEIEKHDMVLGEIAAQSLEISKVAEEPLETIPKSRPDVSKDFDFLPDETDMAEEMNDDPAASPDPGDVMDVQEEQLIPGPDTKVYVMQDYQSGEGGYEGILVGKFSSSGDEFGVVETNGDIKDVPMRDIKRASEFRRLVKFAADRKQKREDERAKSAQAELRAILAEIKVVDVELSKEADSSVVMPMLYAITDQDILQYAEGSIYGSKIKAGEMTDQDWQTLVKETGRWMPHVGRDKTSQHFPSKAEWHFDSEQIAKIKNMFQNLPAQSSFHATLSKTAFLSKTAKSFDLLIGKYVELDAKDAKDAMAKAKQMYPTLEVEEVAKQMGDEVNRQFKIVYKKKAYLIVSGSKFFVYMTNVVPVNAPDERQAIEIAKQQYPGLDKVTLNNEPSMGDVEMSVEEPNEVPIPTPMKKRKQKVVNQPIPLMESSLKEASEIYCKNPDCERKATVRRPDGNWCETHAPEPENKKEAAPGDKPALSPADPKTDVEPEIKGPEMVKPWKKAPEGLREEKPVLAPDIVNNLYNQVKDTEIKIQKIKTAADEIMKKAAEDARKFKEEGGEQALTEQYQVGVQKLYAALEAINAKVVEVDSTLLAFIKEKGPEEIKWTAAEKLKRVIDKFPEVEKYLENALNGAQSKAKTVERQTIVPFPKAHSFQLSRFDKRADMMDTLNYILENLGAAYQALTEAVGGSEPAPQQA